MNAVAEDRSPYVTSTKRSAWFAVNMWWNPEGFWEPWQTGPGRYATQTEAEQEARDWAQAEGIRFVSAVKP